MEHPETGDVQHCSHTERGRFFCGVGMSYHIECVNDLEDKGYVPIKKQLGVKYRSEGKPIGIR